VTHETVALDGLMARHIVQCRKMKALKPRNSESFETIYFLAYLSRKYVAQYDAVEVFLSETSKPDTRIRLGKISNLGDHNLV
jgi:hypothetical protein